MFGAEAAQVKRFTRESGSLPVVDLASALEITNPPTDAGLCLLVVEIDGDPVGISVSGDIRISALARGTIIPLPALIRSSRFSPFLMGLSLVEEGVVLLLDLEALARDQTKKHHLQVTKPPPTNDMRPGGEA